MIKGHEVDEELMGQIANVVEPTRKSNKTGSLPQRWAPSNW